MIISSFQVTICDDELPPVRRHKTSHRDFRLEELQVGQTQIIEMDTVANAAMVTAIKNYLKGTLGIYRGRSFRTVIEPNRLYVRRVV